jgi:capsular exopolysaccharide synthesis family protein
VDWREALRAVVRHWWLVVVATVVSVGIAGVLTATAEPQYRSSLTFFVSAPGQGVTESYQGGLFSQQRVKSYAALLNGDRLAAAIASSPRIDLPASAIRSKISGRVVPDSVLLEVTVTDTDPRRARAIASELARDFVALVEDLETPPGARTPAATVAVVSGPSLNLTPVSPQPVRNLGVGLVLGLLLGVAAALTRSALDVTISSADQLRQLTGMPVLSNIPLEAAAKGSPLIMSEDPQSTFAEAVRHLRTNLRYVDVDHELRVMVITSSVESEGKSTTAVNLALAFARAGQRVLLIEADLRRPKISNYLGIEGAVGLSNVLAGLAEYEDVVQPWGQHEFWVLPGGFVPPNPSELLGSRQMADLVARVRNQFDIVLIDAPPLLPVTDAAVVAKLADGAVLVVRHGRTSRARITAAVTSLHTIDVRILGTVLTMTPVGRRGAYYYAYRYGRTPARRRWFTRKQGAAPAGQAPTSAVPATPPAATAGTQPPSAAPAEKTSVTAER